MPLGLSSDSESSVVSEDQAFLHKPVERGRGGAQGTPSAQSPWPALSNCFPHDQALHFKLMLLLCLKQPGLGQAHTSTQGLMRWQGPKHLNPNPLPPRGALVGSWIGSRGRT